MEAGVQQVLTFWRSAVVIRHWFEIDLDDASMEHGARIELRELVRGPHRGSESASQLITADRPLWRADLFDRLTDEPGSYGVAHYHPEFAGNEPCGRNWDPRLSDDPWGWLHDQFAGLGAAGAGSTTPELDPEDAREISGLAGTVVAVARQFAPERCHSAGQCYGLTRDARTPVQRMVEYLRRPDLLDTDRVAPYRARVPT
jgi:hypothetical protein